MVFLHIETNLSFSLLVNLKAHLCLQEMALSYQNLSCKTGNCDTCSLGREGEAATYTLLANEKRGASLRKSVLPAEHWPDLELKVWALGDYTTPGVQGSMDSQQPQAILSSPQTQC